MISDILRRDTAPITPEAWSAIDDAARRILKPLLSVRIISDFNGPHGWELGAVDTGRLDVEKKKPVDGITWGVRKVQPLVEIRAPFTLGQMELDSISRGMKDPDLKTLEEAARKVARFEENASYNGFEPGCIKGLIPSSEHKPLTLGTGGADAWPAVVSDAVSALLGAGVSGPYALTVSAATYQILAQSVRGGYPLIRIIQDILQGGQVVWSLAVEGGVVVSTRGGDFELTIGQDFSIGYWRHNGDSVDFYITESFTFRVFEPQAIAVIKASNRAK